MSRGSPLLLLILLFSNQQPPVVAQEKRLQVTEKKAVECEEVFGGTFSPDGAVYVQLAPGDELHVIDTSTGKRLAKKRTTSRSRVGPSPVFSPDGTLFAFIGTDGQGVLNGVPNLISLWDTKTWKQTATLRVPGPKRLIFSPDSQSLAVQLYGAKFPDPSPLSIWEVKGEKGPRERAVLAPEKTDRSKVYSPDGKHLFTGWGFWNTQTEEYHEFPGGKLLPEGDVSLSDLVFSQDSRHFSTESGNEPNARMRKVWDLKTGKEVTSDGFRAASRSSNDRVFSPDGMIGVRESTAGKGLELFTAGTGKTLATIETARSPVVFSKEGKALTGLREKGFTTWELTWESQPSK